jgi:GTP-binding protein
VPKGGPDGGDGGRGGDVVVVADPDLRDLSSLRGKTRFAAKRGGNGRGTRKHGADAEDVVLTVPVGTVVADAEDGSTIADMRTPGARVVVARGGGASPRRRARRLASRRQGCPGRRSSSSCT